MTQPKRKTSATPATPATPAKPGKPSSAHQVGHKRRAYVCYKCEIPLRIFVTDPSKPAPRCGTHGPMVRQDNRPYFGKLPV